MCKYLSAEAVSKHEKKCHAKKKYAFWIGQGIFIYLLNNRVFAVQVWMFSSLFLCLLIFFFVWLQWEANQKSQTNVHKILQHLNFSFLTEIAKHRAHGLCDTDLETLLALKFYF